jgi:hypothetical protein
MKSYHLAWLKKHPNRSRQWLAERLADGFHIHHIDCDHSNDKPENLVLIEGGDHFEVHAKLAPDLLALSKLATAARKAKIPRWRRIKIAKQAARARWKRSKRAAVPTAEPGARLELRSGQSRPA